MSLERPHRYEEGDARAGAAGAGGAGPRPYKGDLYVFRGRRGDLIKIFWHDGFGTSLYAKKLSRGRFIWPATTNGAVALTQGQLGYLLEGIDWPNPQLTWRPQKAG